MQVERGSLAIEGGEPVRAIPFPPWPIFGEDEIRAVGEVLAGGRVNYWTGDACRRFEEEFAVFTGTQHAISLANGTLALELALFALDIGPGDEVIVPARTFIASASCVVARGAVPVVADIDPVSQNLTVDAVRQKLTSRTRAIIAVHLAGWPCDMDPIMALARERGIKVVEDCAQAHGATYKGRSVGSLGDCAAFSFCQDKIMTTGGEGGMVTTNDEALWRSMWSFKDHGKSYAAVYEREHPPGFRWLHEGFGTNWRMLEMQAAVGRIQLRRMAAWHDERLYNARQIWNTAAGLPGLRVPQIAEDVEHAAYKCYVYVEPNRLAEGWNRDRIAAEINAEGVPCYQGSCSEVYLEKAFDGTGWRPAARLEAARELGETSLMFLVHPGLKKSEIALTCDVLTRIMHRATA